MRKYVFVILTAICLLLSPYASALPDGLETVLHQQHLTEQVKESGWAIMADYSVDFVQNPAVQSWVAGIIGILVVGGICLGFSALLRRKHAISK